MVSVLIYLKATVAMALVVKCKNNAKYKTTNTELANYVLRFSL